MLTANCLHNKLFKRKVSGFLSDILRIPLGCRHLIIIIIIIFDIAPFPPIMYKSVLKKVSGQLSWSIKSNKLLTK